MKVGINGAWKDLDKAWVGINGVWKEVEKMWAGVGGVWKEVEGLGLSGLYVVASYYPPSSSSRRSEIRKLDITTLSVIEVIDKDLSGSPSNYTDIGSAPNKICGYRGNGLGDIIDPITFAITKTVTLTNPASMPRGIGGTTENVFSSYAWDRGVYCSQRHLDTLALINTISNTDDKFPVYFKLAGVNSRLFSYNVKDWDRGLAEISKDTMLVINYVKGVDTGFYSGLDGSMNALHGIFIDNNTSNNIIQNINPNSLAIINSVTWASGTTALRADNLINLK